MTRIDLSTPWGVTVALLPEVVLSAWALLVLLVVSWRHQNEHDSRLAGWLSFAGVALSGAALAALWVNGASPDGLAQMVALDAFRYGAAAIALLSAGATILLSLGYLERERLLAPEYYPLVLFAAAGMMFLGGAEDLIVLFLGLEVMSVAVYALAGFNRGSAFSAEAALKYFLIGAFASGFLLYGIALVYGATGTTNLSLAGAQLAGKALGADGLARTRSADHRFRVQGGGGAVPHVGAGRVRRLAHAGDGLHGHRRQGGGVRGVRPSADGDVPFRASQPGSRSSPAWPWPR